jgi:type IX secretion system PorP/SprF family membrane protein
MSKIALTCLLLGWVMAGKAQLYPLQTMYFQNQYLYNPALAGMDGKVNLNFDYMQQWSNFPGSPRIGSLTADFQPTDKVGLGLYLQQQQYGLIKQTLVKGSYAYHLPLNGSDEHLNFGLSLGVNNSRVNTADIVGDQSDVTVQQYNQIKPYIDGDLGIAYTSSSFSLGAALPNLHETFFKTSDQRFDSDQLLFMTMASYKFPIANSSTGTVVEPMVAYRVIRGYSNIVDAGFNLNMKNLGLYLQGVYQSSRSMIVAVGYDGGPFAINVGYTYETGQIVNYTDGSLELGLKLRF